LELGNPDLDLRRTATRRFLAIILAAVVVSFAFQAVAHFHARSFDEHQCRVCHVANSVAAGLTHAGTVPPPVAVARLVLASSVDPTLDLISHPLSSRAPPA
jgi:hypothetical protein